MSGNNKRPTPPNNPYAAAAGTYGQQAQAHTPDQRELEGIVLLKAARKMQELQKKWDAVSADELDEVLRYNRQIWMMFVDTAVEDKNAERPDSLRSNIANLGAFIFKQTIDILATPQKEKLNILIDINRDIAAGLMAKQKEEAAAAEKAK